MSLLNTILKEVGSGDSAEMGNLAKVLLSGQGDQSSLLDTVVETMKEKGLEDQVSSWIGDGENASISSSQLSKALGGDVMETISEKTGIPKAQLATALAALLPVLVNRLTPDGKPGGNDGSLVSVGMSILKGIL